ncbi:MAG: hypothetical protein GWN16_12925 [Calditrichae bacterium]|nr:hypothetical protein [Calditrichia bacterium]
MMYQPLLKKLKDNFGDRLKTVVLFGSQARSKAVLNRDNDIFVVVDDLPQDPLKRLKQIRQTILYIPLQINFIAKTPEEVEHNLTPLLLEICVDGICLYGDEYFEHYRQRGLRALKQSGLKRKRVGKEWYWQFDEIPKKNWELTWEGFREFE